ncbi:MAG TPA: phosphotransferase, partial [Anaerolineae bacterium]|nr:phosphotransferase [Anaerolineae bacterium]
MAESFDRLAVEAAARRYADLGGEPLLVEPCPAGRFNTSFFVRGQAGEVVVRIAPGGDAGLVFYERGMMAREPRAHELVREKTSAPVARVLGYDTRRDLLGRDFMVLERLPGKPLSASHQPGLPASIS